MPRTVSDDMRAGKQASLKLVHPQRRFAQVTFNVQNITSRASEGYSKIVVLMDVLTRFVRAVSVRDEIVKMVAKVWSDEWISVFGPIERLFSDQNVASMERR